MSNDRGDGMRPLGGRATRAEDAVVDEGDFGNTILVGFKAILDGKLFRWCTPMDRGVAEKLHRELGRALGKRSHEARDFDEIGR